jgi:squalene synthase HpnC
MTSALNNGIPSPASDLWASLPPAYRIPERAPSLAEAQEYCRALARSHYENFSVATWFLPARLHQHFYNVYAYCRISDDLGDETGNRQHSLALLDLWESELNAMYAAGASNQRTALVGEETTAGAPGNQAAIVEAAKHPVFVALAETVREFGIPRHEFSDLLTAFRQDQTVTRYETFDDVLGYCHYSANPVGHLVLYLGGYSDAERQRFSDFTCTALQLANFWQDVSVDFHKDRIYLPLEDLRKYGVSEDHIAQRRFTPEFKQLMKFEVERAREWFERGLPLVKMVDREFAVDLELFTRGGQSILSAIEAQGFDVLKSRPVVSKPKKLTLLVRAVLGKLFAGQSFKGNTPA